MEGGSVSPFPAEEAEVPRCLQATARECVGICGPCCSAREVYEGKKRQKGQMLSSKPQ